MGRPSRFGRHNCTQSGGAAYSIDLPAGHFIPWARAGSISAEDSTYLLAFSVVAGEVKLQIPRLRSGWQKGGDVG